MHGVLGLLYGGSPGVLHHAGIEAIAPAREIFLDEKGAAPGRRGQPSLGGQVPYGRADASGATESGGGDQTAGPIGWSCISRRPSSSRASSEHWGVARDGRRRAAVAGRDM